MLVVVASPWWREAPATGQAPVVAHAEQSTVAPSGMKSLPGGVFMMGSDDREAWPAERPAHLVKLDPFWIDETEVTNAQFPRSSRRPATSPPPNGSPTGRN